MATMSMPMEGPLSKWTNVMKGWQYRWFVLDDNSGLLSYYTEKGEERMSVDEKDVKKVQSTSANWRNPFLPSDTDEICQLASGMTATKKLEDGLLMSYDKGNKAMEAFIKKRLIKASKEKMMKGARRGCVRMKNAVIGIDDGEDSTFTITVDNKTFHFQARDGEEREKWIRALEETKNNHASMRLRRWDGIATNSVQDFEKKLTETDCYLQIFIEQIKNLEVSMEKCNSEEEKEKYRKVHEQANKFSHTYTHTFIHCDIPEPFRVHIIYHEYPVPEASITSYLLHSTLDFIKHAIVLLQIAKVRETEIVKVHGQNPNQTEDKEGYHSAMTSPPGEMLEQLMNLGKVAPVNDESGVLENSVINQLANTPVIIVPETSYSSSEDDDFYDAHEEALNTATHSPSGVSDSIEGTTDFVPATNENEGPKDWFSGGVIDYDAMYNADEEEDLGSVEDHGSVISHLLSQVKLGMDLTKVVLPTFILECRSLLEMYADFFAHPDYFTSIVDFSDPKDRMVQVVRWYLSAFHAGRKSSKNEPKVSDGPVPWTTEDQLSFVAEQVSHHPPSAFYVSLHLLNPLDISFLLFFNELKWLLYLVSAFYAEHFKKRISFCAHIWTKSKFLGLSIGVHNIGQGCVSLLDLDEEYFVTFPNGYGSTDASLRLAPSPLLGFLVLWGWQPFYGGKKHRVTTDVYQPGEKKPFLNISGEWNGTMQAKWSNGKTETFIDTKAIPIIQKEVRPVSSQLDHESRRLWKDVTANLRLKDVSTATEAKFKLEQLQREEAKERKDNGTSWETRLFHEIGENWIYDSPLQKRLLTSSNSGH
ncbi:Oxysterol-binding protein-related protein 9 [Nymphon striatum]|nr:Oxysterol-binding protein-related protein 9 [Nymphon striatum]